MAVDATTPRMVECQDCGWHEVYEGSRWQLPTEQARQAIGGHHTGYPDHEVDIRPMIGDGDADRKSSAPDWSERRAGR